MIADLADPTSGIDSAALSSFARILSAPEPVDRARISIEPDNVKKGLGKLVLTVVELLRDLLERQAIRRIDTGTLTDVEIERLGTTFLQLSEQMEMLKGIFGLDGEDLNIDLGPLGKLL